MKCRWTRGAKQLTLIPQTFSWRKHFFKSQIHLPLWNNQYHLILSFSSVPAFLVSHSLRCFCKSDKTDKCYHSMSIKNISPIVLKWLSPQAYSYRWADSSPPSANIWVTLWCWGLAVGWRLCALLQSLKSLGKVENMGGRWGKKGWKKLKELEFRHPQCCGEW